MTKVSVIIPFHNVEQYISKCIQSLVCQTLNDIELIFINDASTDNSEEIVKNYMQNDKRIILLNTNVLSGQAYARNLGLEIATGEYIGFVDSDDWIELDMFEKMYNKAKENDTDITMCQVQLYDDKEQKTYTNDYYSLKSLEKYKDNVFSAQDTKDEILNINVVIWNKIYKREFLNNIQAKFQNGYIYEDLPFFYTTYLKANKINVLWQNLYFYRQNRTFSTMTNSDKKVYDRIPMVELTYKILQTANFFNDKKIEIVSWVIDDIFHRYTLLEDKYYEDYYSKMKAFFQTIELTKEDKEQLSKSYCYDEFCCILERSYFGFWNFLIEKYKTSNKMIKNAKHECNIALNKMKEYVNEQEQNVEWWKNHCDEKEQEIILLKNNCDEIEKTKENEINELCNNFQIKLETQERELKEWQEETVRQTKEFYENEIENLKQNHQNLFNQYKIEKETEIKNLNSDFQTKLTKQEYELKIWQKESVRQTKEKLTSTYEWKIEDLKQHYQNSLNQQKEYYENKFLLVKIMLKLCKQLEQLKNKVKKVFKKN